MSKIARRWILRGLLAAGGAALTLATLTAPSPAPATAARSLPAVVDRAEQATDRVLPIRPPRARPAASDRGGKCPGPGHGSVVDGQQPPALKPPSGGPDLPCLAATVAVVDTTLERLTVARARAHLSGRSGDALDPRPS
ncbi:hypothetical protein [Micromonospora echinospora]|uniref:hypothetical protein n=1 Tax=Micromonospora echinospora TaxID=1877 RepID=UPI003A88C027